jgi:ClpP class serine protease
MQGIVDEYYDLFVADVAAGRGTSVAAVRAGYGQGRMVTARQAVDLGMADRVDSLQATVERLVREPARPRRAGAEDKTGHPAAQLDPGSPLVDEEAAARTRNALLAIQLGR